MARVPLTLRMLVLVPLLAASVDLTRASVACGPRAQTCLEAAGRGWLGPFAVLLVVLVAAGTGWLLARARPTGRTSFARTWALGTAGVAAAVAAQELIARTVGDAPLAGTPLGVLALCVAAGAFVALALRAVDEATRRTPKAPRVLVRTTDGATHLVPLSEAVPTRAPRRPRGRAPPLSH